VKKKKAFPSTSATERETAQDNSNDWELAANVIWGGGVVLDRGKRLSGDGLKLYKGGKPYIVLALRRG